MTGGRQIVYQDKSISSAAFISRQGHRWLVMTMRGVGGAALARLTTPAIVRPLLPALTACVGEQWTNTGVQPHGGSGKDWELCTAYSIGLLLLCLSMVRHVRSAS